MTIRLSKSKISNKEKLAVQKVLDKEFLGMGTVVKEFEDSLTDFFGRKSICVVNGTAALQLALEAIDIKRGDEVLLPSLTYLSCFQAVSSTGATPIPVEINEKDLTICKHDLEKKISSKSKVIMPMHYAGSPCDLKTIYKLAKDNNLRVIEDAAHAFGSFYKKKLVGSFGDIACFSFDGIKNITSGEGGCIVSNNIKIINKVLEKRSLGIKSEYKYKYKNKRKWNFDVTAQGWRYHMSNIMAAIGKEQLKKIKYIYKKRNLLARKYNDLFSSDVQINTFYNPKLNIIPHIYVVRINKLRKKYKLRKKLLEMGIETGEHYKPNHMLSYYKTKRTLPITEKIYHEILTLPLHNDLKISDIKYIAKSLSKLVGTGKYF